MAVAKLTILVWHEKKETTRNIVESHPEAK